MLNLQKTLILSAAIAAAAIAVAQGHTSGHFRFQGSDGGSLVQLAQRDDVQKELKVNGAQKTKLADLENKLEAAVQTDMQHMSSVDNMRNTVMNTGNDYAKKLPSILDATQNKRLLQLLIQQAGYSSLERSDVQKDLGFSKAQSAKVDTAQTTLLKSFDAVQKQNNKKAAMLMVQSAMMKHTADLKAVLTKSQASKFEAMKGKPFAFASMGMGMGMPAKKSK